jgi:hypothetical protein
MHTYSEILVKSIAVQSATRLAKGTVVSSKTFSTQWWGVSITLHPIVVALEIGPKGGNVIIVRNIQSDE